MVAHNEGEGVSQALRLGAEPNAKASAAAELGQPPVAAGHVTLRCVDEDFFPQLGKLHCRPPSKRMGDGQHHEQRQSGEAAARLLSAEGAIVVLGARRADRLQALANELTAGGAKALAVATDVTDRGQVQRLVDTAVQRFGRIDVIINNAGLMPQSPLERLRVDEWDRMIDVNIKGVLYGIAAALPHMKQQKAGHIINVSSVAGHKVGPGSAVYAATKHAVRALSEGLRLEVKPYNIRTTVISPGAVATELPLSVTEPDVADRIKKFYKEVAIPAESFARAVAYAMSQPADVDVNEILFRPTRQEL